MRGCVDSLKAIDASFSFVQDVLVNCNSKKDKKLEKNTYDPFGRTIPSPIHMLLSHGWINGATTLVAETFPLKVRP